MLENEIARIVRKSATPNLAVPGSTVVTSFGDPRKAEIATLGINPSSKEFLQNSRQLYASGKKRLVDFETLGLDFNSEVTESHAERILEGCLSYFSADSNPYMAWFGQLENLILNPLGLSYLNSSAVHLDLVQTATFPVWSNLTDSERKSLLDEDLEFLKFQLNAYPVKTILVNGRSAVNQVNETGLVELEQVDEIIIDSNGKVTKSAFYKGELPNGSSVFGWTFNLQSMKTTTAAKISATKQVVATIEAMRN
jgi:hypothetical protein